MELFDTHAHLDDDQLLGDLKAVLDRANCAGVRTILAVGTTAQTSRQCVELAQEFDAIFAAVGIQPNYGSEMKPGDWEQIVELASDPSVRAIGETGLDAYWDFTPLDLQRRLFEQHLGLAQDTGKPFIVHMRDCGDAVLEVLHAVSQGSPLCGVMHSFTGDTLLAERCLELGLYISFAGMVTFKKSADLQEVARMVPHDRLLIETDSPYLSPHPHRGKRPNEPSLLCHTAECVAAVRGVPVSQIAECTTANAKRLFGFDND